jgi:hypothetical protein
MSEIGPSEKLTQASTIYLRNTVHANNLKTLSTESASQLDVLGLNSHSLSVDRGPESNNHTS